MKYQLTFPCVSLVIIKDDCRFRWGFCLYCCFRWGFCLCGQITYTMKIIKLDYQIDNGLSPFEIGLWPPQFQITTLQRINFSRLETLSFGPKIFFQSKGPKNAICLWLWLRKIEQCQAWTNVCEVFWKGILN